MNLLAPWLSLVLAVNPASSADVPAVVPVADATLWKDLLSEAASAAHESGFALALAVARGWRVRLARLRDATLRRNSLALVPELVDACVRTRRSLRLQTEVEQMAGKVKWSPGGPAWLRALVGDEAMGVFAEITELNVAGRQDAHSKDFHRSLVVDDAWVERLAGLRALRRLDLGAGEIHGPGLKVVGTLKALEWLNLTLCPVSDDGLAHLAGLSELRALMLASTKVTGTGWKHLAALRKLENLNCHSSPIDDEGLRFVGNFPSLERLEIVHTHFTDAGARHLTSLKNLRRLQIGSPHATAAALAPLSQLPMLAELDIHDRQATAEGLGHVGKIASLRLLRVPPDAQLAAEVASLRQSRPDIKVNP